MGRYTIKAVLVMNDRVMMAMFSSERSGEKNSWPLSSPVTSEELMTSVLTPRRPLAAHVSGLSAGEDSTMFVHNNNNDVEATDQDSKRVDATEMALNCGWMQEAA